MPENEIQRKLLNGNDKIIAAINEKEVKYPFLTFLFT